MLPPHSSSSNPLIPDDTPSDQLDEIIGEYLAAQERGNAPSRPEFLAAHPEFADELAEFLADEDRFDAAVAPLVGRSSSSGDRKTVTMLPRTGQTLGRYELLEELGRGGMGVVYKARQKGVNRLVALKMIGSGPWTTPSDLQRFRLEAAAIAEMDHPHIVPLYEVGEEEGQPFYSMKWVEGGSLAARIEKYRDRPRDAVRLLLTVARAVEHAHQHGILHRDLKPGNILIDSHGQPHVTDFGLAKKLEPSSTSSGIQTVPAAPTLSGTALGTPSYMAPEQARNARAVTTAADVYSLGAILYEMLTGQPPFRRATSMETILDVLERDPEAPSELCEEVDDDLDTICLKCLQKEPGNRYSSAAALADDLQRYFNGETIQARPVGRVERFARWCQRQPVVAGLSAAVIVSVVVGLTLVLVHWQRAEEERDRAENEKLIAKEERETAEKQRKRATEEEETAKKALKDAEEAKKQAEKEKKRAEDEGLRAKRALKEAEEAKIQAQKEQQRADKQRLETDEAYREAHRLINKYCIQFSEEKLKQYPALRSLRMELLRAGLKHYQDFLKRNEQDPRWRKEIASTHFLIGVLQGDLGKRREALTAYVEALKRFRELASENPGEDDMTMWIAETLFNMASHQGALGDLTAQRDSLVECRAIVEQHKKKRPNDSAVESFLSKLINNENGLEGVLGRPENPPVKAEQVVAMRRKLLEKSPGNADFQAALAGGLSNLALAYNRIGRSKDALNAFEEARGLIEKLLEQDPDNGSLKRDLCRICRHLGNRCTSEARYTDAAKLYDKARELLEGVPPRTPANPELQADLADVYADMGSSLFRQEKSGEGMKAYETAVSLCRTLVKEHPGVNRFEMGLSYTLFNLGNVYRRSGNPAEALKRYKESESLYRTLMKRTPQDVNYPHVLAGTLNNMADVLQTLKRPGEAIKAFEEGVRLEQACLERVPKSGTYRAELTRLYSNLARAYRLDKRHAEAVTISLERRQLWLTDGAELVRLMPDFLRAARLVPENAPERRRYVDHAVETLSMALTAGYRDHDKLRKDPDLALLREREEFERLLQAHAGKKQ
jgi:tetratricopeptide (TPR) repeat protein